MSQKRVIVSFLFFFVLFLAGFLLFINYFYDFDNLNPVTDVRLRNASFIIAFLGGVLSIFSPCTIAVLPAFISYTFKEKSEIAKMTLVFFAGFSSAFMILGLLIAYLGKISFVYFQKDSSIIIQAIGFLLVLFGILTILGKGFTFVNIQVKPRHDFLGVFTFGALFAVGWSACTGPIVSGILTVAAAFNDYTTSALLLFFYSLGIAVPLFIMAFLYDTYDLSSHPILKGKEFSFKVLGQEFLIHSTKLVSGIMLISLGILFLVFKGTTVLTGADLFGRLVVFVLLIIGAWLIYKFAVQKIVDSQNVRHVIFALLLVIAMGLFLYLNSKYYLSTVGFAEDMDRIIIQNSVIFNLIGALLLVSFVVICVWFVFLRKK